jgi:two-component system, LytTR family, sensor kinase
VAILLVTQGVLQYRAARERELRYAKLEGQLARAHLQALNAQIRPHFLFNTLHTIGQMWRSGRSDEADAVLDRLGALFHRVQRTSSAFEIPLREELDVVREYLAIEQARFRDRLHTSICAPPETLDWMVPPLILQPIVENAIRHGLSAISSASIVEVHASVNEQGLTLTVRDDGPGMSAASSTPGTGTGLRNTRERLEALYGKLAELQIENAPDRGTVVRMVIPASHAPHAGTPMMSAASVQAL